MKIISFFKWSHGRSQIMESLLNMECMPMIEHAIQSHCSISILQSIIRFGMVLTKWVTWYNFIFSYIPTEYQYLVGIKILIPMGKFFNTIVDVDYWCIYLHTCPMLVCSRTLSFWDKHLIMCILVLNWMWSTCKVWNWPTLKELNSQHGIACLMRGKWCGRKCNMRILLL